MASNTLPRDFDIARILADYRRRIEALELAALRDPVSASIWQGVPGGFDTGWQSIVSFDPLFTPQAGANEPFMRRFGPIVMIRGRATTTAAIAGNTNVFQAPAGFSFEPPAIHELGRSLEPGSTGYDHRFFMGVTGQAAQQGMTIAISQSVSLSSLYSVDVP